MKTALGLSLIFLSSFCSASLISKDFISSNDGLITYDTASNLEWLDLSVTKDQTYMDVLNRISASSDLNGWSFASYEQIQNLYNQFGYGDITVSRGTPQQYEMFTGYFGGSFGMFGPLRQGTDLPNGIFWIHTMINTPTIIWRESHETTSIWHSPALGSFLVRSAVPVPASAWLFASSLLGSVAGFNRRKIHRRINEKARSSGLFHLCFLNMVELSGIDSSTT